MTEWYDFSNIKFTTSKLLQATSDVPWMISRLLLSLPNFKSPLHSLDLAMLARTETVRVRIYSRTWLYRTRNMTNPCYIKRFFTFLNLICLKKTFAYIEPNPCYIKRFFTSLDLICLKKTFAYIEPLLHRTSFCFPWVFDIMKSNCNTILWLLKIVGAKLQGKDFDVDFVIKVTYVPFQIMTINWFDQFK